MCRILLLPILIPIAFSSSVFAGTIAGRVVNQNDEPLSGVTILVIDTKIGATTDHNGLFSLQNIPGGEHYVQGSSVGFESQIKSLIVPENGQVSLFFKLEEVVSELENVVIHAHKEASERKLSGYNVDILSIGTMQDLNLDVNQILGTMSGVNIRQNGGLGSDFEISLNGLTGNQVRYFIDEVPMEFYGSALSLNNFPSNLVEAIQVYKGTLPVHLATDALGGGINFVTPTISDNLLDVSYSVGSFNTHRVSLYAQRAFDSGLHFKLTSFYNHSDNDYEMNNVSLVDDFGNVLGSTSAKRFHSAYTSASIDGQIAVTNKSWTDEFTIGVTYASNSDDIQHTEVSINRVYGGLNQKNSTLLGKLRYRKEGQKLSIKNDVIIGRSQDITYDTLRRRFNWQGESVEINTAEYFSDPSVSELQGDFIWARTGYEYQISSNHLVSAYYSMNYLNRTGQDKINPRVDALYNPQTLNKNFIGLSYDFNSKDSKLKTSLFSKYYWYQAQISTEEFIEDTYEIVTTSTGISRTGYGAALSYFMFPNVLAKTSFEYAYRLPNTSEIMGDGVLVLPSPNLKPESSHNFNMGLVYQNQKSLRSVKSEITGFYRPIQNKIWPLAQGVLTTYENISKTRVVGVETSHSLTINNKYLFNANLTYQKHTDRAKLDEGLPNSNFGERLPNDPYFFGNASAQYIQRFEKSRLTLSWSTRYIHAFFLYSTINGGATSRRIIPLQFSNDLNASWTLREGTYNVSISVSNLFDEEIYDNWSLQKPGRAFYLKLRLYLNK